MDQAGKPGAMGGDGGDLSEALSSGKASKSKVVSVDNGANVGTDVTGAKRRSDRGSVPRESVFSIFLWTRHLHSERENVDDSPESVIEKTVSIGKALYEAVRKRSIRRVEVKRADQRPKVDLGCDGISRQYQLPQ